MRILSILKNIIYILSFHVSLNSFGELCVLSAVTGGRNEMRGEHRSQLPLSLAGVRRLCLWTLSEGHRVVPPQRHVKDKVTHWGLLAD